MIRAVAALTARARGRHAPCGSNGMCITCAQPAVAGRSRAITAPVAS